MDEEDNSVTMVDVLKEQEAFEEDAKAVLGASDDKNCTYGLGYVKRQALYACLTCSAESVSDSESPAGVCLACSLACHENHNLVELYTKRNFRCDCSGPKFPNNCSFNSKKNEKNVQNTYNQNFSGLYCTCHRPYPDPDDTVEDEMIQCIVCEDWFHSRHLNANLPPLGQYSEMICEECTNRNEFLETYLCYEVNCNVQIEKTSEKNDVDIETSFDMQSNVEGTEPRCDESEANITNSSNIEAEGANQDVNKENQMEVSSSIEDTPVETIGHSIVPEDSSQPSSSREDSVNEQPMEIAHDHIEEPIENHNVEASEMAQSTVASEENIPALDSESKNNLEEVIQKDDEMCVDTNVNLNTNVVEQANSDDSVNLGNVEHKAIDRAEPPANDEGGGDKTIETHTSDTELKSITDDITTECESTLINNLLSTDELKNDTICESVGKGEPLKDDLNELTTNMDTSHEPMEANNGPQLLNETNVEEKSESLNKCEELLSSAEILNEQDSTCQTHEINVGEDKILEDDTSVPADTHEDVQSVVELSEQEKSETNKPPNSDEIPSCLKADTNITEDVCANEIEAIISSHSNTENNSSSVPTEMETCIEDSKQLPENPSSEEVNVEKEIVQLPQSDNIAATEDNAASNEVAETVSCVGDDAELHNKDTPSDNVDAEDISPEEQDIEKIVSSLNDEIPEAKENRENNVIDNVTEVAGNSEEGDKSTPEESLPEKGDSTETSGISLEDQKTDVAMDKSENKSDEDIGISLEYKNTDVAVDKCDEDIGKAIDEILFEEGAEKEISSNSHENSETSCNDQGEKCASAESHVASVEESVENNISGQEIRMDNCTESMESKSNDENQSVEHTTPQDNVYNKKRKPSDDFTNGNNSPMKKKIKQELIYITECIKPAFNAKYKRTHGATFWPSDWRTKLCSCKSCVDVYAEKNVVFLLDLEDTVSAYEDLGKIKTESSSSQYEKGMEALSSLGHVQQINAITEYNKMKEKLLEFLKTFKDKKEVVKEEDIKGFFAGMKPKREPDGVYFCR